MVWHWLVSFTYLLSSVFYCSNLWINKPKLSAAGYYLLLLGAILHTASLIFFYSQGNPIAGGIDRSLYFFSWLIALVYIVSQVKFKAPFLGTFVAPICFLMTIPSLIVPQGLIEHDPSLRNPWILVHIVLIFLGEALFTIAFFAAAIYIFQERRIKSKRPGRSLKKLPSLTTLDNINHLCLLVGFPLLTIGLTLGIFSAKEIWGETWRWGHKETWSLVTWFLYAVLIHGRMSSGWKGKKVAIGALLGFGLILFTYFVIGYFAPGQHDFLGIY